MQPPRVASGRARSVHGCDGRSRGRTRRVRRSPRGSGPTREAPLASRCRAATPPPRRRRTRSRPGRRRCHAPVGRVARRPLAPRDQGAGRRTNTEIVESVELRDEGLGARRLHRAVPGVHAERLVVLAPSRHSTEPLDLGWHRPIARRRGELLGAEDTGHDAQQLRLWEVLQRAIEQHQQIVAVQPPKRDAQSIEVHGLDSRSCHAILPTAFRDSTTCACARSHTDTGRCVRP